MHLSKGDFVWVDAGAGVPIGAQVQVTDTGQLQLIDDEGKEHKINKHTEGGLRPMHPTSVQGVDDMIRLGDLNEAGLLRNLLVRHKDGLIYTYTGSILVAVNPYQLLPLYTADHVHQYTDRRLGELPPHVFAIADSCFFKMRRNHRNQCCVISGESGAGKTESTKLMLQFLAAVSGQHSWIEQQILEANPILEAFGNAKTIRNDNSSRFGKYIDINFTKGGAIEGARIEQYLLEKSRVCRQAPEERNYHIFYYMLMGMAAEQKKILSLGNAAEYNYLTMGKCTSCEGRDDVKEYAHFRSALKILMFSENDTWEICKLLAAILHIGNVNFEGTIVNNLEGCDVLTSLHFDMTSQLLEVDPKVLEKSLTQRSFNTIRESVSKVLNSAQALDGRDAFVKAIYGRLFIWVVDKINAAIHKPPGESDEVRQSIGLLDIFGFENFNTNSFEQLCINYANEQLQQFFVKHVFKLEQEEYARESIVWERINYKDNQETLDVLANKALNILALIDEESNFPKGTDTTLLQKMNQVHGKGSIYISPKNNYETQFGISHFAGIVHYDSKGFLEKNRDALSPDLIQLVETSSNKLLKLVFHDQISTNNANSKNTANPKMVINTPKNTLRQTNDGKKRVPTLTGQFRQSLDSLMKTLMVCQPYFIRCIKPNDYKKPMLFDRELCLRQLRYSGMMETIRIRKAGYPVRYTFDEFLERYRVLLKTYICDPQKESKENCCESICESLLSGEGDWKTGKTKIFLKDFHDTLLEVERMKELNVKALLIQKVLRGYKYRKQFVKKRAAALVIQKHWRGHKGRQVYRVVQKGFARLQAEIRSRQLHVQYKKKRQAAVLLQAQVRGYVARKNWKRKRDAVILLQAQTRGLLARRAREKMMRNLYLSAQEKEAERRAALERQKHLEEVLRQKKEMEAQSQSESQMDQQVDDIFGFLPVMVGGQEGQAPAGFETLENKRVLLDSIDIDTISIEDEELLVEDQDELDEYPFSKLASMYFQGGATPSHIRQRLRRPLLYHEDEGDVLASLTVWWIILRFMGDLPEPKKQFQVQGSSSQERFLTQDVINRKDRRLSHMVGLDQRVLRNKKVPQPSSVQEESTTNRKGSMFTDLLSRNKKPAPAEAAPNARVYTVPEGSPRARKGSTFTDLLSRTKKNSNIQENVMPRSSSSFRKPSIIMEESEDQTEVSKAPTLETLKEDGGEIMIGEGPTLDRPLTSLEKLHIIVGYAIVRRDLRDEIYCQICKQLHDNNNRNSYFRGWILLSLCLGVFPPSDQIIKYIQSFIRSAPSGYAVYCSERLRRTLANGVRGEPPAWLELQATKTKKPMVVSVTLMDGRSVNIPVDSASTSKEICELLANTVKLKDTFGFSIYVALYEKVWALGGGREHVMDAISQCEQEVKRRGGQEQHAPWRLFFRKEIFTPWHDCSEDKISTELIYRQVVHGLKFGEYLAEKEDDFVQLAAKHLYIQHGSDNSNEAAKEAVQAIISNSLLEAKSEAKWVQMVSTAYAESSYLSSQQKANSVKAEIVDYARERWPIFFSRFFEVVKVSGPAMPKNKFIVAINWTGITFLDEREKRLLELSFPEVTGVNSKRDAKGPTVSLLTLKGDFTLSGSTVEDMAGLVTMFLSGLTERSQYAVTLKEIDKPDDPTFLGFKKGELIIILKDNEFSQQRGWINGQNDRTGKTGAVPMEAILILPTLSKPSNEVMSLLNLSPNQRKTILANQKDNGTIERQAPVTLREFSLEYFRQPTKDVNQQVISRNSAPERLWLNSREPIRQPLLKKLVGNTELSHKACLAFTAILKYMGDYPTKQMQSPLELTDQIFEPAMENENLRDEIYCQIMKQMSSNNNRFSVEQGWQLLWLCCGLFPPSQSLLKHAQKFLESRRREALAPDCLKRLQSSLRMEPRKFPPHQVEVDAIQQNSTQIFHKVHFPNDTGEIFEVATSTKIRDLIRNISSKLQLTTADGFSIFIKTHDKVLSLNDSDYFFDSLRQITDWSKKSKRIKDGKSWAPLNDILWVYFIRMCVDSAGGPVSMPYLVFFMRKLWFNVIPGRDLEADLIFHFPQEVPKYLRGYHVCTKDDIVQIASLLFRIKVANDKSQFPSIPKMLKELAPADQLKAMSENEWKKSIVASYNKQQGMTVDEAKVAFLKAVHRWQTFGCAFFEVKQTSEPSFPDIVRIAISKQGLTIIHPKTKEVLANHPFNRIANWCSGSTYFHMTIGSLVKGSKFLCETSLGYKMDDLITSYVNMYLQERRPVQSRNQRFN
ncbi:unconventional myosin-VIIb isoform X2 [Corythoichthys intestinalis]|uniref:unconventional myosin-VIIb isoform X2 n=1 Tax=Corythoichthys intestinalis TaxID=161448 RepID=UPI0025A56A8B|nr:unconventional myosin-VIIb isoform X2 [Corythoichthys intestinalis]